MTEATLAAQQVEPISNQPQRIELLSGMLGSPQMVEGRKCLVTSPGEPGVVVYGPYERRPAGAYEVEFLVGIAGEIDVLGDPVCFILEVLTANGAVLIVDRRVLLSHLRPGLAPVRLGFTLQQPRKLEFRVSTTGQAGLNVAVDVRLVAHGSIQAPPPKRGTIQRAWKNEREFLDGYLRNVTGVVHIGANIGQERRYYWLLGLDIIWIEPIREIYEQLVNNTAKYDRQRAINTLLADVDGREFEFSIANNNGASSSILPLEDHAKIFPDVAYVETRKLTSTTLASLMRREVISTEDYQALTVDAEGAELLILKGAGETLSQFKYVKCEVADFPARTGTPTTAELDDLLRAAGFGQLIRRAFTMGPGGKGTYWDIVWKRIVPGEDLHEPGYDLPLVADPADVQGLEKVD